MKKIITLLLIIVSSLSVLSFTTSYFVEESSAELSSHIVKRELEKQVHRVVDEMNSIVPLLDNKRVEEVIIQINKDPKLNETIDRYTQIFIKDIAEEEKSLSQIINKDIHALLYAYTDDFSQLMGNFLSQQIKEDIIKGIIDRIDLSNHYDVLVTEVDSNLSNDEMKIMRAANFFYQHLEIIRLTTLLFAVFSLVFALLLNLSGSGFLKVLILESFFILVMHLLIHLISKKVFFRYLPIFATNLNYSLLIKVEFISLIVFLVSFLLKRIIKNQNNN